MADRRVLGKGTVLSGDVTTTEIFTHVQFLAQTSHIGNCHPCETGVKIGIKMAEVRSPYDGLTKFN